MEIDKLDLKNMLRHAYLLGHSSGNFEEVDWGREREEIIEALINDHLQDGKTCYNDYPCNCPTKQSKESWIMKKNSMTIILRFFCAVINLIAALVVLEANCMWLFVLHVVFVFLCLFLMLDPRLWDD